MHFLCFQAVFALKSDSLTTIQVGYQGQFEILMIILVLVMFCTKLLLMRNLSYAFKVNNNVPFLSMFLGPFAIPESLCRVQNLTGKSVTFYGADLCNKSSLREVFSKVSLSMIKFLKKNTEKNVRNYIYIASNLTIIFFSSTKQTALYILPL